MRRGLLVVVLVVVAGCSPARPRAGALRAPAVVPVPRSPPLSRPAPAPASPAPTAPSADGASPQEIARARALVEGGLKLYRQGDYDGAERSLKEAITAYPFMAEANVTLAKILLIRASASRDMSLYTNARLMLEMARALDPRSREIEQLLELVRQPTAE